MLLRMSRGYSLIWGLTQDLKKDNLYTDAPNKLNINLVKIMLFDNLHQFCKIQYHENIEISILINLTNSINNSTLQHNFRSL